MEKTAAGVVISGFEYTYDEIGQIVTEKVLAKNVKLCYTYDDLSRVTKRTTVNLADNTETVENYSYDAAGNITEDGSAYDTNNRLTMHNYMTVSYDDDGNMLSDGTMNCTFDSANRLTSAAGNAYTYDAENMRIRSVFGQFDTTYTHNTNAKLSQLLVKTTNGVVTKYVYGLGLIGEETNSSFTTYHFDYRGSTVALTNASGAVTDMFEYDTYGQLIARTGSIAVIFGYNGRDGVITDENGLIYMRARYYSPCLQRFVNADVLHGKLSNAITLNRYAYANGNPVSFVDPFGLAAEDRNGTVDVSTNKQLRYIAVDTNSDGVIDYYLYKYLRSNHLSQTEVYQGGRFWKTEILSGLENPVEGNVYIYVNVDSSFFKNQGNIPEGFNPETDILIGDFTANENPNMYAYQAQDIDPQNRRYIIEIMLMYDEDFNTPWERTEDSLEVEWREHHRYQRFDESAQNIDFDNAEEGFTMNDYFNKAVERGFGKILRKLKSFFD